MNLCHFIVSLTHHCLVGAQTSKTWNVHRCGICGISKHALSSEPVAVRMCHSKFILRAFSKELERNVHIEPELEQIHFKCANAQNDDFVCTVLAFECGDVNLGYFMSH